METRGMTVYTMKVWLLLTAAFLVWALQCEAWHGDPDAREPPLMQMAQGQGPRPMPGGAGQPQQPALLQPPAAIRIDTPMTPIPARPMREEASPPVSPKEPAAATGEATEGGGGKVPQVTVFPELTRGVGDSQTLLQE